MSGCEMEMEREVMDVETGLEIEKLTTVEVEQVSNNLEKTPRERQQQKK